MQAGLAERDLRGVHQTHYDYRSLRAVPGSMFDSRHNRLPRTDQTSAPPSSMVFFPWFATGVPSESAAEGGVTWRGHGVRESDHRVVVQNVMTCLNGAMGPPYTI